MCVSLYWKIILGNWLLLLLEINKFGLLIIVIVGGLIW